MIQSAGPARASPSHGCVSAAADCKGGPTVGAIDNIIVTWSCSERRGFTPCRARYMACPFRIVSTRFCYSLSIVSCLYVGPWGTLHAAVLECRRDEIRCTEFEVCSPK